MVGKPLELLEPPSSGLLWAALTLEMLLQMLVQYLGMGKAGNSMHKIADNAQRLPSTF